MSEKTCGTCRWGVIAKKPVIPNECFCEWPVPVMKLPLAVMITGELFLRKSSTWSNRAGCPVWEGK